MGLRPLVCFAKCRYTAVSSYLLYACQGAKHKPAAKSAQVGLERYRLVPTVSRLVRNGFVALRARGHQSPMPVRLEVCGLLLALSVTDSVPVAVPVCVGANVTLMVQLFLLSSVVPQVEVEIANGAAVE